MVLQTIKGYLKIAAIVYVVAVTVTAVLAVTSLVGKAKEVRRLEGNQQQLMSDIVTYKTKDGLYAAETKRLELTVDEYKSALEASEGARMKQKEVIESLNIKIRRMESIQQTITETRVDTVAKFLQEPFIPDTLKLPRIESLVKPVFPMTGTIEWCDPWVSLKVRVAENGRAAVSISSVDTLYQIVHRVPRRFLCIPFGTKAIRQEVVSSNPHTKIIYSEYIELKRK